LFAIYYNYIWFEYSEPYPSRAIFRSGLGKGFCVDEIWDEKDHNIIDLKKKGIYFKGFFNHDGNICRWKNIEEIQELQETKYGTFSTNRPAKIEKYCRKIKLIKL